MESGFHIFPENFVITEGTAGSLDGSKNYAYIFRFEHTDDAGRRIQSSTRPITIGNSSADPNLFDHVFTNSASNKSFVFDLESLSHTLKDGVLVAGYRTRGDGIIFFRFTDLIF